jgi:hypothetical protein
VSKVLYRLDIQSWSHRFDLDIGSSKSDKSRLERFREITRSSELQKPNIAGESLTVTLRLEVSQAGM